MEIFYKTHLPSKGLWKILLEKTARWRLKKGYQEISLTVGLKQLNEQGGVIEHIYYNLCGTKDTIAHTTLLMKIRGKSRFQ